MTRHITSDPWCNAVMEQWNAATEAGDRGRQLMFVGLCEKHKAPSIDWQRVAEDAGIKVPTPITEDRAIAQQEALAALVYEVGRIIEHSGSSDLIAAYNHARGLLANPEQPDDWISQNDARRVIKSLTSLSAQVDRLMAASIEASPDDFTTALRMVAKARAGSLEEPRK